MPELHTDPATPRGLMEEETGGSKTRDIAAEEMQDLVAESVNLARSAIQAGDAVPLLQLAEMLHPADLAALLHQLDSEERTRFIEATRDRIDVEALTYLDESVREDILEQLDPKVLAAAVAELDSDDAIELLEDLDEDQKRRILAAVPPEDRAALERGLTYPADSAGRLMQMELVALPRHWTVGEAIDFLRASEELPDDFYELYIVDPDFRPIGSVPLSRAMRTKRSVKLSDIMSDSLHLIPAHQHQEEVAHLFRRYGIVSAPVVDEDGRLAGVIMVDDVVRVIEEEAEDDLMKLGGVSEIDIYRDTFHTARSRSAWLGVNLITALIASVAIGFFQDQIEKLVALAVLMPIVASMGGNAGTQTLTVAVRAIAMKDLTSANVSRFVIKEALVGSFNGVVFALLIGVIAGLWFDSLGIGLVIGAALILNLLAAALSGTLIPLGLERIRIDPAIASGVFLTTVTDIIGFVAFLGLASWLLL